MSAADQAPTFSGSTPRSPRFRELPTPTGDGARELPVSAEAEMHVIGCCLLDDGVTLARCLREKISPDSFYSAEQRLVFQVLVDMQRDGKPITLEVLIQEMIERKTLEAIGGMPRLVQIAGVTTTTANAAYFIQLLREKWLLRKFIAAGQEMIEQAFNFDGDLEDFAAKHALKLQRAADFVARCNRPAAADEARAAREVLESILAGNVDKSRRLTIGTPYLDQVFLPWDVKNEDWYVIIAGVPSGGKSSFARQAVGANCNLGKRAVVFLLETSKRRWLWALAATMAHVNLREILEAPDRVPADHLRRFREWEAAVTSWVGERLWIFDDVFHVEDMERIVREIDRDVRAKESAQPGADLAKVRGLDLALIDYLQLAATREKIRMREEYVAHMSRTLKRLFKSVDITGLVLSQFNRDSRKEERRPRLSDLRESGAIEQDADGALLLHTPPTDKSGVAQTGERSIHEIELIQAKRRNGPANLAVDLLFHKTHTRFEDAVRKGDVRPGAPKPKDGYKREGGQG